MNTQALAQAVVDETLRGSLTGRMSAEEASAFEEYVSEYEAAEMERNKKDS